MGTNTKKSQTVMLWHDMSHTGSCARSVVPDGDAFLEVL